MIETEIDSDAPASPEVLNKERLTGTNYPDPYLLDAFRGPVGFFCPGRSGRRSVADAKRRRRVRLDAALGRLDDARLENIHQTVLEIIEDLAAHGAAKSETAFGQAKSGKLVNVDARKLGRSVFCIPGLGRLDDCAAIIVADVLKREGIFARTAGLGSAIEADAAETVCVCFLEDVTEARTDFTRRKISRQAPSAKVVVCLLGERRRIRESDEPPSDVAPRSLKDVLMAVEKNVAPSV